MKSNAFGDGATLPAGSGLNSDLPRSILGWFARRCLDVAPRGIVRRLNRISQRLAKYTNTLLGDETAKRRARDLPVPLPMTVGDVRFTLWLPPGRNILSADYQHLSSNSAAYEPVMLACLTRLLRQAPASRFIDIGAHLGYYACYVSALFSGQQEVYAVESNPLYVNAIHVAARLNKFSHLRIFQEALSDRIEPVYIDGLAVCHNGPRGTTMALTLDELCKREQVSPTILKMDVHGAEGKIVLGMRGMLADLECILLEVHKLPWLGEYSPGVTRTAMLDALEESGLALYHVAGHIEPFQSASDFGELLAGRGYCYRRLDRRVRDLMLFDRSQDTFVLGLRNHDIEALLGPSILPANA
jgi:FkbM family methyltransferase